MLRDKEILLNFLALAERISGLEDKIKAQLSKVRDFGRVLHY